jgi:eukaryotic-like serine/threonine-protein kinase
MERTAYCYRFGTAEFDEARFELRVAGLPVDVERRALEVLAYLLQHAGEVATKDELLREVWAGRITVDKVLPNAINKLRRALGEANASRITTQARVGYRLDGVVTRTAVGRQPASTLALAPGQAVPGRPNFLLLRQLGHKRGHPGSEVWLAEHQKTREQRVYKFGLDVDGLRSLKREATLLRVLQDSLDGTDHIVELLDWNFENSPYFLECKYGGLTLAEWAEAHLSGLGLPARLALFLQIADAVAAAHSVGVLHKDLKPANVLVMGDANQPHVRLTDFGSGHLLEPDRLAQLGITRMGATVDDSNSIASTSGTPLYIAPELFEGQSPTVKSDVFALGIVLYQLLSGRIGQPMVSGWDSEIGDELLRDDLRLATDGNPERRLASAAELAERLRRLDARRAEQQAQQRMLDAAQRDREALARTRARRPYVQALVGALAVGVAVALWLQQQAVSARNDARVELQRATALARFLNEDFIGRSNPLVSAKGPDATLREVLMSVRERVPARFGDQPLTAAEIHSSLASLFTSVDLQPEAEAQARAALELLERHGGATTNTALRTQLVLVNVLALRGRFDEAQAQLASLERLAAQSPTALTRSQVAAARSVLSIGHGKFGKAATELRTAMDELAAAEPDNTARHDALRLDLISTLALASDNAQARAEGTRLIEEAQRRPGDNELLIALARLVLVRALGQDRAAAEAQLLEAKPVILARLGKDHKRYLTLLNELHRVALERGQYPKALAYAQEAHQHVNAKYSGDHAVTNLSLLNWARALSEAGRSAEAVDKVRVAHEKLQRVFGPKGPRTQLAAVMRAQIELDAGHTEQAQALIEQLDLAVLKSGHAIDIWPAVLDALRGIALQQRGDAAAARPLLDSALEGLKKDETWEQPTRLFVMTEKARSGLR